MAIRDVIVEFTTPHHLLLYLVELSDSDRAKTALMSGEYLMRAAIDDGVLSWENQTGIDEFARLLFALRDDGSIDFEDQVSGVSNRAKYVGGRMELTQWVGRIHVTSQGRIAAATAVPQIAIEQLNIASNVANVDLTALLVDVERQIDALEASEETKEEARSRLHQLRELAKNAGAGAAGQLIATALQQILRQLSGLGVL